MPLENRDSLPSPAPGSTKRPTTDAWLAALAVDQTADFIDKIGLLVEIVDDIATTHAPDLRCAPETLSRHFDRIAAMHAGLAAFVREAHSRTEEVAQRLRGTPAGADGDGR